MSIRGPWAAAGLAALFVSAAGCSSGPPPIVPAGGVVLLGGQPVPNVKVRFVPQFPDANEYVAQGTTDENGRFTLTCKGQPGACAGANLVVLSDEIPEELTRADDRSRAEQARYLKGLKNRPIPNQYLTAATSPVKVTVAAGQAEYKIELSR